MFTYAATETTLHPSAYKNRVTSSQCNLVYTKIKAEHRYLEDLTTHLFEICVFQLVKFNAQQVRKGLRLRRHTAV